MRQQEHCWGKASPAPFPATSLSTVNLLSSCMLFCLYFLYLTELASSHLMVPSRCDSICHLPLLQACNGSESRNCVIITGASEKSGNGGAHQELRHLASRKEQCRWRACRLGILIGSQASCPAGSLFYENTGNISRTYHAWCWTHQADLTNSGYICSNIALFSVLWVLVQVHTDLLTMTRSKMVAIHILH